ncbi:Leucine-rich repeat [Trinorchestia longiramus]|nr:Leucine-rich repeat [Trinorchestia longiramus]
MRFVVQTLVMATMFIKPSLSADRPQLCEHRGCECLIGAPYVVECKNAELTEIPIAELMNADTGPYEFDWIALFDFNMINNITKLPAVDHLLLLSFSGNPIQTIEDMAFADLPKLRELRLAKGRLTGKIFTKDAFKGLRNEKNGHDPLPLEVLDVSHNDIRHLDGHAFSHFNRLRTLIFSDNPINDFDVTTIRAFNELEHIVKLDLSRTGLERIPKTFFARMSYLEELYLSGNHFRQVPDEVNYIKSLKVLNLDFNPIKVLRPSESYIHGPSKLSHLSISYMPLLTRIDAESFTDLQNLTVIHMAHNPKLNLIHKMAFASSGNSMKEMYLQNSKLTMTHTVFQMYLQNSKLTITHTVFQMYLQNSKLTMTHTVFQMYLQNNELTMTHCVPDMYLQNNSFSTLAEDLLDWSALERLDAQHNPWMCDCDMAWFAQGPLQNMIVQQPQLTEYIVCAKPASVLGENMKALVARDYEFVCTPSPHYLNPAYYGPIIVATIFIGALLLLAATILCTYVLYQRSRVSVEHLLLGE